MQGCFTYVKWTCVRCGGRQTYGEADTLPVKATCPKCGAVTNIKKHGGGFLLAVPTDTPEQAQSVADYITTGAREDGFDANVEVVNLEKEGLSLDAAVARMVKGGDSEEWRGRTVLDVEAGRAARG